MRGQINDTGDRRSGAPASLTVVNAKKHSATHASHQLTCTAKRLRIVLRTHTVPRQTDEKHVYICSGTSGAGGDAGLSEEVAAARRRGIEERRGVEERRGTM